MFIIYFGLLFLSLLSWVVIFFVSGVNWLLMIKILFFLVDMLIFLFVFVSMCIEFFIVVVLILILVNLFCVFVGLIVE